MEIYQHSRCNGVLGVSEGQAAQGVAPLPVCVAADGDRVVVQSFWMPTPEEVAAIIQGHPIMLTVWGRTHAPVCLQVSSEKE